MNNTGIRMELTVVDEAVRRQQGIRIVGADAQATSMYIRPYGKEDQRLDSPVQQGRQPSMPLG